MQMSISLNNSTVLVLVNGKKFELTRTRTRNSNSTWLETPHGQTHRHTQTDNARDATDHPWKTTGIQPLIHVSITNHTMFRKKVLGPTLDFWSQLLRM